MTHEIQGDDAQGLRRLDPPPDELRQMIGAVADVVSDYFRTIQDRRIYPDTTAPALRERLAHDLPVEGEDFSSLLGIVGEVILPFSRHQAHPRFFGYIASPGTAVASLADWLASVLTATVTSWRSAPAATEVERLTLGWIKQILGYSETAEGLFLSGGSLANFAGLAAALGAKAPDVVQHGMRVLAAQPRIYISEEGHHSIRKAAGLLGIGRENVCVIRTDDHFRMDITDLVRHIERDRRAGLFPLCVVASAGTVATGAIDPLAQVADIARHFNLWFHVDGAYGGFAALAPSVRPLLESIPHADSVALDPHKWLYVSAGTGCVLYRDPEAARAVFGGEADYMRILAGEADEAFAFWNYGPELTRRFRALAVWMVLRFVGTRALGQAMERNLRCARYLARLIETSDDFELLAPVELSVVCFRYLPSRLRRERDGGGLPTAENERELDDFNERLLIALQRRGAVYLSNARLRGRFALRVCVLNYRTTEQDMEILLEEIRRTAAQMTA